VLAYCRGPGPVDCRPFQIQSRPRVYVRFLSTGSACPCSGSIRAACCCSAGAGPPSPWSRAPSCQPSPCDDRAASNDRSPRKPRRSMAWQRWVQCKLQISLGADRNKLGECTLWKDCECVCARHTRAVGAVAVLGWLPVSPSFLLRGGWVVFFSRRNVPQ
jgi:hypothetical protein